MLVELQHTAEVERDRSEDADVPDLMTGAEKVEHLKRQREGLVSTREDVCAA